MRIIVPLFLLVIFTISEAQVRRSPLSGNLAVSLEGGLTIAKTDYKTSVPGTGNRGIFEYFFGNIHKHTFGVRIFGGGQNILGEDKRKEYSSFRTGMYYTGLGVSYVYELNKIILPYASAGISHLWFSTEQETSEEELHSTHENTTYAFLLEAGTRLRIMDNLYFNFSTAVNFLNDDLLDNTQMGINNDFYVKTMAGFSFTFVTRRDSDNDGIEDDEDACSNAAEDIDGFRDDDGCPDPDNDRDGILDAGDKCPELPEDPDGFEDNDGCPDLDNDKDGIPDTEDNCANIPEDFDGYEDEDGCAELDNDGDGILDVNDRCPELPEDFDGFEDSDGCADLDNDGDGIYDEKDRCPDQPETINNFEDSDGCPDIVPPPQAQPDQFIEPERPKKQESERKAETTEETEVTTAPKSEANNFLLHAITTFEEESSQINPQAYAELNRIAEAIKNNSSAKWRIEGYMDNSLPSKESADISLKRAQAIKKYLVSKGISQAQLEAVGMGDKNPIESNEKTFGRLRNRRVEIKQVK